MIGEGSGYDGEVAGPSRAYGAKIGEKDEDSGSECSIFTEIQRQEKEDEDYCPSTTGDQDQDGAFGEERHREFDDDDYNIDERMIVSAEKQQEVQNTIKTVETWYKEDIGPAVETKFKTMLDDVDVEDDPDAMARSTGAAGRQSESKKELLKVVENNINRLMRERIALDKIYKTLVEAEMTANAERNMYMDMIKYVNNTAPTTMPPKEWEKFFIDHFLNKAHPLQLKNDNKELGLD